MRRTMVLAALLAMSPVGQAIDCQRAAAADERRICAVPQLLALDRELAGAYASAQQRGDRELLRADQLRWLRESRKPCGGSDACLTEAYRQRLALLKGWHDTRPLPVDLTGHYPMKRRVPLFDPDSGRWQTESLEDCLSIGAPLASGELPLRIYSVQTNGHSCEINALAQRDGDGLLVEHDEGEGEGGPCRLRLHFHGQRIRVQADHPACQTFCGARASLDGIEYPWPAARSAPPVAACTGR